MKLEATLELFAQKLYNKAVLPETPLPEATEAFKVLTAFYVAKQKAKKDAPEEPDEDEFSFANAGVTDDSRNPPVRARRAS